MAAKKSGNRRVRYSKGVVGTGTTFSLAGYRYASENYNSLSEVINPDDDFMITTASAIIVSKLRSTSKLAIRSVP